MLWSEQEDMELSSRPSTVVPYVFFIYCYRSVLLQSISDFIAYIPFMVVFANEHKYWLRLHSGRNLLPTLSLR